jgi:O-antigen/teichoic acid export membrane protein
MNLIQNLRQFTGTDHPVSSLGKRFAAGMSWTVVGTLIRQIANFCVGIYVARILGIVEFGKLAVIQSTILMLAGFGQAGIGLSATKYIATLRTSDQRRTGRIIGFTLAFTGVSALSSGLLLITFSSSIETALLPGSNLSGELKLAGIWVIFELINLVQLRILAGLEAFRGSAMINLWQSLFLLPLAVVGAYSAGLEGAILAMSLTSLLSCIVGQLVLEAECARFGIAISFRDIWREKKILRMSSMVWLSSIAMNTTSWLVGILLARQPFGISEFGLYNAAGRFQNILLFLPMRIFEVSVPVLSNLHSEGNQRGFKKAMFYAGSLTFVYTLVGSILMVLFASRFMSWYGTGFAPGADVLKIISIGCVASSLWTVASAGLWAAEKSKQMLMLDVLRGFILVALCLVGLSASAVGLSLAQLTSYAIGLIFLFFVLYRYLKVPWSQRHPISANTE